MGRQENPTRPSEWQMRLWLSGVNRRGGDFWYIKERAWKILLFGFLCTNNKFHSLFISTAKKKKKKMSKNKFVQALKNSVLIEKPRINTNISFDKMFGFDILLLMIGGACTALQGVVNGVLSVHINGGFSSWLSFAIGSFLLFIFFMVDTRGGKSINWKNSFKTAPWWSWWGGIPGAAFVLFITLFIPYRGAAVVSGITICAQMITSLFVDSFAFFGCIHRPATLPRIFGILLMIAGVLMVALG